jgi:hypothetical protein
VSALALAPQPLEWPEPHETLDYVIARACQALAMSRPVACPVCGGAMQPIAGEPLGACRECGTVLT